MSVTSVKSAGVVRWRISLVLAVTLFVNYLDRNNLALALPRIARDFGWSDREVGAHGEWLLGAFFLSYALSNMLLSPLAERFGPKRSVIAAIAASSLFNDSQRPLGAISDSTNRPASATGIWGRGTYSNVECNYQSLVSCQRAIACQCHLGGGNYSCCC
ncbi:MFS transporter [Chroococcidiopsis sp. FACHB-1243]|nr:MFS transporter [Chroococcidiopsis sp. [FACHB-1243]]